MADELFDALANEHRREILLGLLDDTHLRVTKLTGVSWEVAESNDGLLRRHLASSREIDEVDEEVIREHHVHLPKLDESGFIEWDRNAHIVTKGPRFAEIRPVLELLDGRREDLPPEYSVLRSETSRIVEQLPE